MDADFSVAAEFATKSLPFRGSYTSHSCSTARTYIKYSSLVKAGTFFLLFNAKPVSIYE